MPAAALPAPSRDIGQHMAAASHTRGARHMAKGAGTDKPQADAGMSAGGQQ